MRLIAHVLSDAKVLEPVGEAAQALINVATAHQLGVAGQAEIPEVLFLALSALIYTLDADADDCVNALGAYIAFRCDGDADTLDSVLAAMREAGLEAMASVAIEKERPQ